MKKSLAALESQAVSTKAKAVSDAVQKLQHELSVVRNEKAKADAELAAAVASRKGLEGELERERKEKENAQEKTRATAAGAEEVRKKLQAVLADAVSEQLLVLLIYAVLFDFSFLRSSVVLWFRFKTEWYLGSR